MQKSFIICYHRVIDDDDSYLRPTKVKEFENQMRYLLNAYNPVPLTAICQHIQNGKTLPRKAVAITLDDGYKDNYRNAYPILRKHKIPATVFLTTKYISTKEIPCWDKVYYILNKARIQGTVSFFSKSAGYSMPLDRQAMNRLVRILKRLSEKKQSQAIVDLANQLDVRLDDLSNEDLMLSWEEVQEMSDNGIDFGSHTLTHPYLTEISHREAEQEVYLSKEIIES